MRKAISFLIFLAIMLITLALSSVRSNAYRQHPSIQKHPYGLLKEKR